MTLLKEPEATARAPPKEFDQSIMDVSVVKPEIITGKPRALDPVWDSLHKQHCATLRSARHLYKNGLSEGVCDLRGHFYSRHSLAESSSTCPADPV